MHFLKSIGSYIKSQIRLKSWIIDFSSTQWSVELSEHMGKAESLFIEPSCPTHCKMCCFPGCCSKFCIFVITMHPCLNFQTVPRFQWTSLANKALGRKEDLVYTFTQPPFPDSHSVWPRRAQWRLPGKSCSKFILWPTDPIGSVLSRQSESIVIASEGTESFRHQGNLNVNALYL